ncbi:MAG: mechanosensitive ion channel family protein [Alphaproteobacteria bacterium]|nr:mechanosensitive ion channel family protein [Alphaproteobacteria bacterium]
MVEEQIQTVTRLIDIAVEFGVAYGLQLLGALVILLIGLKVAKWTGRRVMRLCELRKIDITLSRFFGNSAKILIVVIVVIITLSNFGIDIAPLVALAGAAAFGLSFALAGPLSNYGAGLVIILTRPFVVGDTIEVRGVSGVTDEVTLSTTTLIGEDDERIIIPNRQIVGEILVNSDAHRIVESQLVIESQNDPEVAIAAIKDALSRFDGLAEGAAPQIGIHDFNFGGIVIGLRYWVPSSRYYLTRYAVNQTALAALKAKGVSLLPAGRAAIVTEMAPA